LGIAKKLSDPIFTSRWVFLRLLAIVYFAAFVSLWLQIDGLIGSNGILPAKELVDEVSRMVGASRYWWLPTLYWIAPSDAMLGGLCAAGAALAILLFVGIAPVACLVGLWLSY